MRSGGRSRLGSFLLGGLLGGLAGLAAARLRVRRSPPRPSAPGLAAFEDAPCYEELLERERDAQEGARR